MILHTLEGKTDKEYKINEFNHNDGPTSIV